MKRGNIPRMARYPLYHGKQCSNHDTDANANNGTNGGGDTDGTWDDNANDGTDGNGDTNGSEDDNANDGGSRDANGNTDGNGASTKYDCTTISDGLGMCFQSLVYEDYR